MITKLTPEQEAQLQPWAEKWTKIGLSTDPANWEVAEVQIKRLYELSGLKPVPFVRVSSPIVGALAASLAAKIIQTLGGDDSAVGSDVHSAVGFAVESAVGFAVRAAVSSAVHSAVRSAVGSAVDSAVGFAVDSAVGSAVGSIQGLQWHWWEGGALWAAYPAWYTFMGDVLGVDIPEAGKAYVQITQSAGYWWPNRDFVMICDRPEEIHRDSQGRLHNETGQSIRWRDGWGLWHWHGVAVPQRVIEQPELITTGVIDEEANAEVRRVLLERYGWDRYLLDGGKVLDKSQWGTLYRKEMVDDEDMVAVQVLNATEEPDGTRKKYLLRVPPGIGSAREAVAWTFDMPGSEYEPEQES